MGLPSSGTLSINDIRVELGASATNQSLATFSNTAGFSNPDAISDFYGFSNLTSYVGSPKQNGVKFICSQSLTTTYYHTGTGTYPVTGDTVYTNSSGTTNIGAGYHKQQSTGYVLTNSSGVVTNLFICF